MSKPTSQIIHIQNKGLVDKTTIPTNQKPFFPGLSGHPALKLSNTIEKLKLLGPNSNYLEWSWILEMHFGTTRVKHIIKPSYRPNLEKSPTFGYNNGAICSVIDQNINPANIQSICYLHKDRRNLWQGLHNAYQDLLLGGVMYYMQKLFLSRMEGKDIKGHLEEMAKIFKHLKI
jgi:hypothetical protein